MKLWAQPVTHPPKLDIWNWSAEPSFSIDGAYSREGAKSIREVEDNMISFIEQDDK